MSVRVVYTGTRKPPAVAGLDIIHVPALWMRCLQPDPKDLPTEPCIAVFFSQNAVECAVGSGILNSLHLEGVVAVGDSTALALDSLVGVPVYTPMAHDFGGVVEYLNASNVAKGKAICSFEIEGGPNTLRGMVGRVSVVTVYATGVVGLSFFEAELTAAAAEWIVFASPRAVSLWASSCHRWGSLRIATIGPTTTRALRAAGAEPELVPDMPELETLLGLIAKA
jgi:uroporphyrinogen-III synthase